MVVVVVRCRNASCYLTSRVIHAWICLFYAIHRGLAGPWCNKQTTKGCAILLEGGTRRANPQQGSTFSSATYEMLRLLTELSDVWMLLVQCCWRSLWIQVAKKKKKKKLIRFHTLSTAYNHNTIIIISTNPRNPMLAAHWHPKPSFSQHQSWRNGFLLLPKLSLPLKQMDHGKFQPSNLTLSH